MFFSFFIKKNLVCVSVCLSIAQPLSFVHWGFRFATSRPYRPSNIFTFLTASLSFLIISFPPSPPPLSIKKVPKIIKQKKISYLTNLAIIPSNRRSVHGMHRYHTRPYSISQFCIFEIVAVVVGWTATDFGGGGVGGYAEDLGVGLGY